MILYNKNLERVDITSLESPVGIGGQSKIYLRNDGYCIKIYNDDAVSIKMDMFYFFQKNFLEGFCELKEEYYQTKSKEKIMAYIMKYYQKTKKNILDMPTYYTLMNFDILTRSMDKLSHFGILYKDATLENIVMGDERITLIDLDSHVKSNYSYDKARYFNMWRLFYIFRLLYEDGLRKMGIDLHKIASSEEEEKRNEEISNMLDELFLVDDRNPVKVLTRRLENIRVPSSIFSKNRF